MGKNIVSKQRRPWFYCDRKRFLLLLEIIAVICLSGCGADHSDRKREVPVQSLYTLDSAVERDELASLQPGIQKITPDMPYEEQLETIIQCKEKWCYVPAEEDDWLRISDYQYRISDMDQNGWLEIICSATSGNGSVFRNTYYEVSRDGKSLVKLAAEEENDEKEEAPDWWYSNWVNEGYYDPKTKLFHYPQLDHTHGGAVDTSDADLDVVLSDGKVAIDTISYIQSRSKGEMDRENFRAVKKFYAGAKEKKLGEIIMPYQEQGGFIDDPEKEKKYYRQIEDLYEQYYQGMREFAVTDQWFSVVNETEEGVAENKMVSEKELRKRMQDSWNSFVIYVLDEKEIENPFFPETAAEDSEVNFLVDKMSSGKVTMQTELELRTNGGVLYLVTFSEPRELSNREAAFSEKEGISEESEKEFLEERMEEFYFYLWVTEKQIYYIPRFYSTKDLGSARYFDEEAEEDWQQKIRLVFYNELPPSAFLVCQEEEKKDSLKEMAKGDHQWIEKHGEDIRCYRAYTSRGEGYDTADILQFVWKRGEGLIGVRSMAHPAGGNSELFWAESFLQVEDGSFSMDQ